ncbi:relaxase/mobilization nuclease domain-containing protein [Cellulophaga baltica]|uniref:relaxase/mobilization nuclease domain-containing protein n=1 Tax=Cellulophaga baltica TaxID=76594 RepID=UPI0037CC6501
MIAKLQTINFVHTALAYCERGGQLLDSHKCLGSSDAIYFQMKENNALNDQCRKQSFHIKIRIAPEDKGKLNSQDWIDISKDYAQKIGFHNNPYAVYIHEENSNKEHIHIVASRIKENNRAVDNGFTNYKNMDFCRDMENKYNLRSVERVLEKYKKNQRFVSKDTRIALMKEKISAAIKNSNSMLDVIDILKKKNVTIKKGRGLNFIDADGVSIKGSQIDRKYSLQGFEKLINQKNDITIVKSL